MQVERRDLARSLSGLYLRKWCWENGVAKFLFDLDDTVCATGEIFRNSIDESCAYLEANAPVVSRIEWKERMRIIDDAAFEKWGVNPKRWGFVTVELAQNFGLSEEIRSGTTDILMNIFQTPVRFLDWAEEGLTFAKRAGIPIGIVTHANVDWTWRKYEQLQLDRFMDPKDVYIVDENGHKTVEEWKKAINNSNISPRNCAVFGDSPRSDINPACEAGVEHCFLIRNGDPKWKIHDRPVDPKTIIIPNLSGLIRLGR